MATRLCHHCGETVDPDASHDCWTTTEAALTRALSEPLVEAWERLRETAVAFGDQRIYASHKSIMFSRTVCYFFVRPRTRDLELVFFLGRELKAPQVRRASRTSRTKVGHMVRVTHRDEVEAPLTDWLREAYEVSESLRGRPARAAAGQPIPGTAKRGTRPRRQKKR